MANVQPIKSYETLMNTSVMAMLAEYERTPVAEDSVNGHTAAAWMRGKPRSRLNVEILSVATANPKYRFSQSETFERAKVAFPQFARMDALFLNGGIEARHSCVPADWCVDTHSWEERTEIYQREALALLENVATRAVADAGLRHADIDFLVVNTISGLTVPSLDARLMNRLDFRRTIERLPIFGFGCGGGAAGLARAAQLAQANPGANVLFLTVELASLCARPNDASLSNFVAAALFADGAAGVVLNSPGGGFAASRGARLPRIGAVGDHCWPGTEHVLGLDIKNDGFGMVLRPELPGIIRKGLREAVDGFLERNDLELESFTGFLIHAGGRKILEPAQDVLEIGSDKLRHSWSVLRDYGNMSSATCLFMLERALQAGDKGPHLMAAFGPGVSAYFVSMHL
jgi:alkylresorcinol/alkylpyrone synthase